MTAGGGIPAPGTTVSGTSQPSFDLTQRVGANVLASATVNTDFAETEVDTRRTNLTRFPLFFPEKRTFFLEGADIFSFGLGLDEDVIPLLQPAHRSRRRHRSADHRGRQRSTAVPATPTSAASSSARNDQPASFTTRRVMAVGRVKQNLWRRIMARRHRDGWRSAGSHPGSWLGGVDFTYATSRFRGDKNFLVGVWALAMDRDDAGTDRTAHGFKIDYPNDLWDISLTYKRIGRDFDPSIGFVPRPAVHLCDLGVDNRTRIARAALRGSSRTSFKPRSRPISPDDGRATGCSWRR